MDRNTKYIITDHFTSKTEEERKQNVLNFVINYINAKVDAENAGEELSQKQVYNGHDETMCYWNNRD